MGSGQSSSLIIANVHSCYSQKMVMMTIKRAETGFEPAMFVQALFSYDTVVNWGIPRFFCALRGGNLVPTVSVMLCCLLERALEVHLKYDL